MTENRSHGPKLAVVGALGAIVLLASPASLLAQSAPATPSQVVQLADARGRHAHRSAAEHVEARITEMHQKLRITAAQEQQFAAYADVMRSNAQTMDALFEERAKSTGPSAADHADSRLHWYAKLTSAHADSLNKLVPVFDTLYQSLSDDQKKIADTIFQRHLQQRRMPHRHREHHAQ